jgi:hypothetical protein
LKSRKPTYTSKILGHAIKWKGKTISFETLWRAGSDMHNEHIIAGYAIIAKFNSYEDRVQSKLWKWQLLAELSLQLFCLQLTSQYGTYATKISHQFAARNSTRMWSCWVQI